MAQILDIETILIKGWVYDYNDFVKLQKEIDERTVKLINSDYQPVGAPTLAMSPTGLLCFCQQFITYSDKFLDEED